MTDHVTPELRALVAQIVRDVVRDFGGNQVRPSETRSIHTRPSEAPIDAAAEVVTAVPSGPINGASRSRTEHIRITGNADLQRFAYRLLDVFENPKSREDFRTGRLKFELTGGVAAAAAPGAVERIENGAVTERRIAAAAAAGSRLVLGRRAVLTPLAREKARTLGVLVEKER
jgi:hypothetical protein